VKINQPLISENQATKLKSGKDRAHSEKTGANN
jgi:hypothetical protein